MVESTLSEDVTLSKRNCPGIYILKSPKGDLNIPLNCHEGERTTTVWVV